jgi:hypothetical protein
MFFCGAKADNAHSIVIRAFSEYNYIKAGVDLSDGHEADFPIIEPIIFALKRRIPIETGRRKQ